ncbi:LPS-assembly protein LptD [Paracoccus jiaweipingae]|uniref:LPS-assembly protein LptD n=1 Tax=unclassified Paracoccus (in: a-proteobacteria) TaxID=2688777 RepID=UPI0037A51553
MTARPISRRWPRPRPAPATTVTATAAAQQRAAPAATPRPRAAARLALALTTALVLTGAGITAGAGPAQAQDGIAAWLRRIGPALAPNAFGGSDVAADGTDPNDAPRSIAPDITLTPAAPAGTGIGNGTDDSDAATLLADQITLSGDRDLTASGGVVVWHKGVRLVAAQIRVDGQTGALTIRGPIQLSEPGKRGTADETVLVADQAQLSRDLQAGILHGARLVLAREMQLAAAQAQRSENGRLTTLRHVVASSCQVCAGNPTPLWEIRARTITHDAQTRQIHFDRPQFRLMGVPVLALPALTAPDPSVERMSGFLRPEIRTTSNLGFGVKLPYFLTLGDHADLTLTPYLSASRTRTLGARWRQAFWNGAMTWQGAVSRDDIRPDETRGYLFGSGIWTVAGDYRLGLQVQTTTDRGYLLDYDVTDADRLWSGVTLDKVTRKRLVSARIGQYQTFRDDETNATLPALVGDALWQRRFHPARLGGEALLEWSLHGHRRRSDDDDIGRDVARASVGLDWRRSQVLRGGVVGTAIAGFDADIYQIRQDSTASGITSRAMPYLGAELRWPLIASHGQATHLLEPVVQLVWSPHDRDDIPNEDSRVLEFDEGNLFSLDRSPGADLREGGLRANLGIGWTRIDPAGYSLGVTAGRVFRAAARDGLGASGPLSGQRSDWLLAAHFSNNDGLAISNRALFDDDFNISRNELRMGWARADRRLSLGYLWMERDATESRLDRVSELVLDTGWQIAPGWWASGETRYDFQAGRAQKAELGLQYRNECVTLEATVKRRFTASDALRAETDFGLSVRLGGFGRTSDGPGRIDRRACAR